MGAWRLRRSLGTASLPGESPNAGRRLTGPTAWIFRSPTLHVDLLIRDKIPFLKSKIPNREVPSSVRSRRTDANPEKNRSNADNLTCEVQARPQTGQYGPRGDSRRMHKKSQADPFGGGNRTQSSRFSFGPSKAFASSLIIPSETGSKHPISLTW